MFLRVVGKDAYPATTVRTKAAPLHALGEHQNRAAYHRWQAEAAAGAPTSSRGQPEPLLSAQEAQSSRPLWTLILDWHGTVDRDWSVQKFTPDFISALRDLASEHGPINVCLFSFSGRNKAEEYARTCLRPGARELRNALQDISPRAVPQSTTPSATRGRETGAKPRHSFLLTQQHPWWSTTTLISARSVKR